MKDGDIVYIDYVAKIKENDQIFDLTIEEIAKEKGIFDPRVKYKPIPLIIGEKMVIKGLEEGLKKMKIGEKRMFEIPPEDAFGTRKEYLIKLIPQSIFRENKIEPEIGKVITINGRVGRIMSISGGRVKVDFNHPLAGKTLIYEVKIVKKAKMKNEKINAILSCFLDFKENDIEIKGNEHVEIILKKMEVPLLTRKRIADLIKKYTNSKKVRFVYEY